MESPQASKNPQIEEQIIKLSTTRENLTRKIIDLLTRLSPVLRNDQPVEESGAAEPVSQLVEIALKIRAIRYDIESDIKHIDRVLERLEI